MLTEHLQGRWASCDQELMDQGGQKVGALKMPKSWLSFILIPFKNLLNCVSVKPRRHRRCLNEVIYETRLIDWFTAIGLWRKMFQTFSVVFDLISISSAIF